MAEKKKSEKPVPDPIALVVEKKERKKEKKKKKKKKVLVSDSNEVDSPVSDLDDGESLNQAMILLTQAFQKKFYKKPGSNNMRKRSQMKRSSVITAGGLVTRLLQEQDVACKAGGWEDTDG
ncbi:hypothetical protein L6452_05785 [Arctium lappa]|uniref:Uncharacterized protein n=1 Tax=Arctium lappa TaxID=4217 RepID=A0ACB9EIE6_ARCLA|nr:hypothetical protein L6452_05785 [Arctium lappa]